MLHMKYETLDGLLKKQINYTTILYLSVQQSKISPRRAVDDPMALSHEAESRGQ